MKLLRLNAIVWKDERCSERETLIIRKLICKTEIIYLNINAIATISSVDNIKGVEYEKHTQIHLLTNEILYVKESPEQILRTSDTYCN